jgi:hypothetical protein
MATKSKFHNVRTVVGIEAFASKMEAARYGELLLLARAGEIRDLKRQVAFELAPAVKIGGKLKVALRYFADFVYFDARKNQVVVEDAKGALTEVYKIKRHLMKTVHNIEIFEAQARMR